MKKSKSYDFVPGFCCSEDGSGGGMDALDERNILVLEFPGEPPETFHFTDAVDPDGRMTVNQEDETITAECTHAKAGFCLHGARIHVRGPIWNRSFPIPRRMKFAGREFDFAAGDTVSGLIVMRTAQLEIAPTQWSGPNGADVPGPADREWLGLPDGVEVIEAEFKPTRRAA